MSENENGVIKAINDLAERFEERFDDLKEDVDIHVHVLKCQALGLRSQEALTTALLPSESEAPDRDVLIVPLLSVGIASRAKEPRKAGSHQLTTAPGQTGWRRRRTTTCVMTQTRKWTGRGADQIWWRCLKRHTKS